MSHKLWDRFFLWGDGGGKSRSGVRVAKTRGGCETRGRWYKQEADTFAKRTLKKHWVVWVYAKGEVMAMGHFTWLCEPVPSPQETVCFLKYRTMGRGPVSLICVTKMSILRPWNGTEKVPVCVCLCVHVCAGWRVNKGWTLTGRQREEEKHLGGI